MRALVWRKVGLNGILLTVSALALYPFLVMLMDSFKSAQELSANPSGFPHAPTLSPYVRLFTHTGGLVTRAFLNSVYISVLHTVLALFLASLAGYAFAKCRFPGRDWLFVALLATMMVPNELGIPPLYMLFSRIGWLNGYTVQIIPGVANVAGLFLVRQYMRTIPDSVLEAAKVEGASHWRIYWSIVLPMSSPVLGVLAILIFMAKWNDLLWPVIMVNSPKFLPIMAVLPTLNDTDSLYSLPWEMIMAGCVLATLPLLALFLRFQDKFTSSVNIGAVKE